MRPMHWAVIAALASAVWASFAYLSLDLGHLLTTEAQALMWNYVVSFFPPDLSGEYLVQIGQGTLETIAISAVGTALAAVFGMLLALPASGRYGTVARAVARLVLNFLRSIPELVWAALMVIAAGLGPFAGTLALAWHTTGVIGRLFAETLENAPAEPVQALQLSGCRPSLAFLYGTMPNVLPQFVAYSLYRWEINIRMAAILGVVGAGGLGQMLYFSLSLFHQQQAMTVILAMLVLVVLVDTASAWLRRAMTGG
ncbi:MAG: phosphonate ABC transporter, permease protein PhnE [Betaproteobacteria bacterium RIFCSPLOWO2_02_FULL_67_26]|nr:MAG: phosphonate ABC transporter, permease protein PhnE [Betaproteobacteria bacterium RIFCSPLOWO2_02_FULL_67_26]